MSVKRSLVAIFGCSMLLGCGGGGNLPPEPVGTQDPQPDPQQPEVDSQNPAPEAQSPELGAQEPAPAQETTPAASPQSGGTGGASRDRRGPGPSPSGGTGGV